MPQPMTFGVVLQSGLDVRAKNADKKAALLSTALLGTREELEFLLESGVDFTARTIRNGLTPLHLAALRGSTEIISLLLDNGFGIEEKDSTGGTTLCVAAQYGHGPTVKLLINRGARIEERDEEGVTALMTAALHGKDRIIKIFMANNVNLKAVDNFGKNSIHYAAQGGHGSAVRLLVKAGLDLNSRDVNGWTPLHEAACAGHVHIIELLLEEGADLRSREIGGRTGLDLARDYARHPVVHFLETKAQQKLASSSTAEVAFYSRTIPNDYSKYTSLDPGEGEIRLLRIREFPQENKLVCSIIRTSLQDHPPYTALSYSWGSLETTVPICISFEDAQKVSSSSCEQTSGIDPRIVTAFYITTNLYDALRSFRHHESDVFIWNDMLCINQGDLSERSHQVAIMSKIYAAATDVTVWIGGDPDIGSDILFPEESKDLEIFLQILKKHSPSEGSLSSKWTAMCEGFAGNEAYDDSFNWNEFTNHKFEIPYESIATDLYLMYSSMSEEVSKLLHAMKLRDQNPCLDTETYFYNTVLNQNSLVLRLATFLSLYHHGEFDEKYEVSWQSLFDVLQRWHKIFFCPWFGRIWVVQEIVNNEIVHVRHGTVQLDWSLVLNYHAIYGEMANAWYLGGSYLRPLLPNFSIFLWSGLQKWHSLWEQIDKLKRREQSIFEILCSTSDFLSTDPRDKIYAIASLANDIEAEDIVADYTRSPEEVFLHFTRWFVQKQESLGILSLCRHFIQDESESATRYRNSRQLAIPSWCPDYRSISSSYLDCDQLDDESDGSHDKILEWHFHKINPVLLPPQGLHHRKSLYTAYGGRPARFLKSDSLTSLQVEGIVVAKVVTVIDESLWPDVWPRIKSSAIQPSKSKKSSTTDIFSVLRRSNITVKRFFKAMAANFKFTPEILEVSAQISCQTEAGLALGLSWSEEHFLRRHNTESHDLRNCRLLFGLNTRATDGRRFFLSHDRRIGLGPNQMNAGDIVAILSGANVPFILREVKLSKAATTEELAQWLCQGAVYQLIGECYLDGRMDGELVKDPLFEDPLDASPLDHDYVLYPDYRRRNNSKYIRKGVYRRRFFHLQ